ncbi:hypothetical protein AVEN_27377-1 [Araneus ventricosus]|uniref:Uncharacterized protein n=1 Tax=Araneus ventricosus TaxID=182803 RepID=A0A4Y2JVB8_ARAVE|nr:hypothetical protein AVEN_27377-1 [Araneus ventricosus]
MSEWRIGFIRDLRTLAVANQNASPYNLPYFMHKVDLEPTRHRVKKSLDEGESDLFPFFLKSGELFIGIPCISSYKTTLQLSLYPLDNVKVWGLSWPVKEDHMTAGERTSSGCAWIGASDYYAVGK